MTIAIAIALMLTITIPIFALQSTSAHTPPWQIPTTAYINVAPNPVGVGQPVLVVVWLDRTPSGATETNNIKFHNFKITITKPDNTVETQTIGTITDPTSSAYFSYTPDQVGTYQIVFNYPGENYTWSGSYNGDVFIPSVSKTYNLTVTQEPLPAAITSYPLPTEYWTRPIEGQNTDWWTIASNWLGSGCPKYAGQWRKIQPDGAGPNSAHVMWTKPLDNGAGVTGGTNVGIEGNMIYSGLTYNMRFSNPIIMFGKLYYELPYGNSGRGGGYQCVDLLTGKELWWANTSISGSNLVPSFGYILNYDDANQHGTLPQGLLFTSNFARAYDPNTGILTKWNMTNVPSGTAILGPNGEHLRYTMTRLGTTANPEWRLTQWNSSKMNQLTAGQIGVGNWFLNGFFNGSDRRMYDWNVSVPVLTGLSTQSILAVHYQDILIGKSTSFVGSISPSTYGTPNPYTFWALSLKPGEEGRLLWIKNYTATDVDKTLLQGYVDFDARVFLMYMKEDMQWYGYSMDNGNIVWGPTERPQSDYDYYEPDTTGVIAYGRFYYSNYGGIMTCFDDTNGKILWTYGNGGSGNTTFSGLQTAWGNYPTQPTCVADGKIFCTYTEHSPNSPLYKGCKTRAINATDGTEIWAIMGYGSSYGGIGALSACADGYFVYPNRYDDQIYCFGKGPSAMTVTAPDVAASFGTPVVIRGTVTDIAAGTKQNEQAARFPYGVPAVSDASESEWMEYVYMQKPRPTNTTGVPVSLDVIDSNGNNRPIGTATSDANGVFSYTWTPDIEGSYTVVATFAGSESYYPSHAESSFTVTAAPPTPSPYPTITLPPTELYIMAATAAIIVAIALVALILAMMLRKRP